MTKTQKNTKNTKPRTRSAKPTTAKKEKSLDKMTKPELLHVIADLKSQLQSQRDVGANQNKANYKLAIRLEYLQECVDQIAKYNKLPFYKKFVSSAKSVNDKNVEVLSTSDDSRA